MKQSHSPIGAEQIAMARGILQKYRAGKVALEQRLIANEQWYKLRHWDYLRRKGGREEVEPVSGWLFNAICAKHADAMDNYPAPLLLPRRAEDRAYAERLGAILPAILEQADFEQTYSDVADDKLRGGTGIYGVFWNTELAEGRGDIAISCIDPINLFWEPGIGDIQKSRNVFLVELVDRDLLHRDYPFLEQAGDGGELSRYIYDESVDTSHKAAVVDWYYKRRGKDGRMLLHYCKFTGGSLLYASENDPYLKDRGWYDHGQYPFVFDTLYRVKGSPCGFGYIDVGRSAQEYIDRGNRAILENLLVSATPRHFIRNDGSINEEEYLDLRKPLIHVDSGLGQDSILPVQSSPLSQVYLQVLNSKVDELKEVTGNRDISTGGTTAGVTAAAAIAAMQEAGSKLSRDLNKAAYRAYRKVVLLVIALLGQFYTAPRSFPVAGSRDFLSWGEPAERSTLFDVQVMAQKAPAYSRLSRNELALQFFAAGFFDPERKEQALSCLQLMDFEGKALMEERIRQNEGGGGSPAGQKKKALRELKQLSALGAGQKRESYVTRRARERVAAATQPR
ncbi:MAG: hypothetical protein IJA48_05465 [Oscillospiraceae bacterium]|nr:hypothetical protein [Oscillospiraceae bacterium]